MSSQRLLTVTELASVLRIAPATLRLWARIGRIPCVRLSCRAVRFDPDQVQDALSGPVHIRHAIEVAFPGLLRADQAEGSDQ